MRTLRWSVMLAGCAALAAEPPGYYSAADGKTGATLKAALHAIIRGHKALPYAASTAFDTADALAILDQSPQDSSFVRLIYSTSILPKSTFGTDAGWNREHLWPNSYGIDDVQPAYSDLHNLRAIDATVNSSRGNLFYDEADPAAAGYRVPGHAEAPDTKRDGDSWEPPAYQKGDIARAVFYMAVRYEGDAPNEPNLELTDDTATVTSSAAYMGRLTMLIEWSLIDPVDDAERARNDGVFGYQGNRNPFIDHPEFVTDVFGDPRRLSLAVVPGGVELRWPAVLRHAVVERSTDLLEWNPLEVAPQSVGSDRRLVLPASGRAFFRLVLR